MTEQQWAPDPTAEEARSTERTGGVKESAAAGEAEPQTNSFEGKAPSPPQDDTDAETPDLRPDRDA